MKQGKTVDIETAEKIMNDYRREREDLRPVIWPMAKVEEACRIHGYVDLDEQPCARPLVHLICDDDEIIAIGIAPYIQQGKYGFGMGYERYNYDGDCIERGASYAFVKDENYLARFRAGWRQKMHEADIDDKEIIEATLASCHAVLTIAADPEKYKSELDAIRIAVQLEKYAFSPYVTYRERRTFKQAMRPRLINQMTEREWPAIEIICLRIPKVEHKEQTAPTGRHISCRYELEPFMRNQWYPSEKTHKLIQVKAHIRGPEGAPLKPKRERVYKVTR